MNIIIIADVDFPEGMAATAHISLMAKGFIKNSINSMLFIPSKSFNGDTDKYNKDEGIYDEIPYKFFNKGREKNGVYTYRSFRNVIDIALYLKKRKKNGFNDVILTYHNNFLKYYPIFLSCYFNKIPLFPWKVEKEISNKEIYSFRTKLQQIGFSISDKILPKISNGMIVISSFLKKYYSQKMDSSKIHISPIIVNPDKFRKRIVLPAGNYIYNYFMQNKGKNNLIVYSGSFGEKDGFLYILKAFKLLLTEYPNSLLVTTGKPSKYNPIENILNTVNEMGLQEKFKYLGLVYRDELQFVNDNADLLLVCRCNSEFANHGFPWKLGEYLMTINPVVATRVGDIDKYLIDYEEILLAEPENFHSISHKMKIVFDDIEQARERAYRGYLKALKVFDHVRVTKSTLDFIRSLYKE